MEEKRDFLLRERKASSPQKRSSKEEGKKISFSQKEEEKGIHPWIEEKEEAKERRR